MAKPASGMYKTKARNLTDAQLKRAKGAAAAAKRTVSVSNTKRETTGANKGYTLGPGGNRLTGTVIMPNGDRAVYKGGKRVTNVPKSSVKTVSTTKTVTKTNGLTAAQKAMVKDKKMTASMPTKVSPAQAKKMGSEGPKGNPNGSSYNRPKPKNAYSKRIEDALAARKGSRYGR